MNELERQTLNGVEVCPFCGQLVAVERESGETPQDAAARVCTCIDAKQYRYRKKRLETANEKLENLFGEGAQELNALRPVRPEAMQLLKQLIQMLVDGQIDSAAIQCGEICKASLSLNSKGFIKVQRTEGKTFVVSV